MQTVWIVEQGWKYEGSAVKGVFVDEKSATAFVKAEIKEKRDHDRIHTEIKRTRKNGLHKWEFNFDEYWTVQEVPLRTSEEKVG